MSLSPQTGWTGSLFWPWTIPIYSHRKMFRNSHSHKLEKYRISVRIRGREGGRGWSGHRQARRRTLYCIFAISTGKGQENDREPSPTEVFGRGVRLLSLSLSLSRVEGYSDIDVSVFRTSVITSKWSLDLSGEREWKIRQASKLSMNRWYDH